MSKSVIDRINYLIALISEFAKAHGLPIQQAYTYLQKYQGLDFVEEFYEVEHTLSFAEVVDDVTIYCKRMGGDLS